MDLGSVRTLPTKGTIGVLATGSPVEPNRLEIALAEIRRRGFQLEIPLDPSAYYADYRFGFANGSADERARAFMSLVENPSVDAIITARGGYGTLDILPRIDFGKIHAAKKVVVGMSDATALLVQCVSKAGIFSVHGPAVATAFADAATSEDAARSADALLCLLSDPSYRFASDLEVIRAGGGEGRIIAGNLTMLLTLLGTPYDIDYRGVILVLEEVGDAPFKIHRAFTQLKLAGKLDELAGLVFGRFSKCEAKFGPTVDEVIALLVSDILRGSSYPVLRGLKFGHWGENLPLPLGCYARIKDQRFEVLESPLG